MTLPWYPCPDCHCSSELPGPPELRDSPHTLPGDNSQAGFALGSQVPIPATRGTETGITAQRPWGTGVSSALSRPRGALGIPLSLCRWLQGQLCPHDCSTELSEGTSGPQKGAVKQHNVPWNSWRWEKSDCHRTSGTSEPAQGMSYTIKLN